MKQNVIFLVCASILFTSCQDDNTFIQTHQYNERSAGDLPLNSVRAIVVQNRLGPAVVEGRSNLSSIGWFLDKWVTAESPSAAAPVFSQMRVTLQTRNDTAFVSVDVPSDGSSCSSLLSLSLPNQTPCILRNIGGSSNVSYLQSALVGENVATINIQGHTGNCLIAGSDGDATIQISLPDSGLCRVTLNSGNIVLKVPAVTSSFLSARSDLGTILLSGLVIGDSVRTQNSLTARLGSGRGDIQLSTGRGNISVTSF